MPAASLLSLPQEEPLHPLQSGDILIRLARRSACASLGHPPIADPTLQDLQWYGAVATFAQVWLVPSDSERDLTACRHVFEDFIEAIRRGGLLHEQWKSTVSQRGRDHELDLCGHFYPSATSAAFCLAEQALDEVNHHADLSELIAAWPRVRPHFAPVIAREPDRLCTLIVNTMRRELTRVARWQSRRRTSELARQAEDDVLEPTHSDDFRVVRLPGGTKYTFTPNQAKCVEVLWRAWEAGRPEMSPESILDRAGIRAKRLSEVFRHAGKQGKKMNPAWGTLITWENNLYRISLPLRKVVGT
jgi:hypothetical protein